MGHFKFIKKEKKIKNKGQYILIKYIYRICNIPIYFRKKKISYDKYFYDNYLAKKLNGNSLMTLAIGEYIVKTPNILEKIQNLIRGVALKEAENILLIIKRLSDVYQNKDNIIEVQNQSEIEALRNIEFDFQARILRINDNAFVYGGYFLPINHFEAGVFYYKHSLNVLESSTLAKIRNKDFIDVGGFIGDSAIIFEREFCDKKIYTFEATKTNFNLMLKTLELNESKRILPINKGLGAAFENLEISVISSASTMVKDSKAKEMWEVSHTEIAEIIPLDFYVEQNNIDVGFIKVDIEGFEQEFLKGAIQTIRKFRPAMLISIYHNPSDFFDIKPLIESWNLGYTFKFHRPIDFGISGELALYCEVLE